MEPILQIEHLSITFTQYSRGARRRELPVIRDLSLSLSPGEVTAVVGASGSGKSLLAHAILGLLPYNSRREGSILYKGQELTPRRLEKLRGREISLVPQGVTYLDPLMKVGPQLTQGRRDIDTRRRAQKAPKAAKNFLKGPAGAHGLRGDGVPPAYHRRRAHPRPGRPSGGAAAGPLPGAGPRGGGCAVHHPRFGAGPTVAHRVAVFYAGETIEEALASDFEAGSLRHPFTQALWDALPQRGFRPIPGSQPYPGEVGEGCPFLGQCPHPGAGCAQGPLPLRPFQGGAVRCLYPNKEVAP